MSNPVAWRGKGRTVTPNARQKRAGLYIDAMQTCHGCWTSSSEHAHHMLPRSFACRNSWYAMRAYCEHCHIRWHRPVTIVTKAGTARWRINLDSHERLLCPVAAQSQARRWQSMTMRSVSGYILVHQHIKMVFTPRWGA